MGALCNAHWNSIGIEVIYVGPQAIQSSETLMTIKTLPHWFYSCVIILYQLLALVIRSLRYKKFTFFFFVNSMEDGRLFTAALRNSINNHKRGQNPFVEQYGKGSDPSEFASSEYEQRFFFPWQHGWHQQDHGGPTMKSPQTMSMHFVFFSTLSSIWEKKINTINNTPRDGFFDSFMIFDFENENDDDLWCTTIDCCCKMYSFFWKHC